VESGPRDGCTILVNRRVPEETGTIVETMRMRMSDSLTMNFEAGRTSGGVHPEKTAIEFFAGIGLVRLGLEQEGWRIVFANDIDPKKQEMYEHHFGKDGVYRLGDIRKLRGEDLPQALLATASFPCNDLSLAGSRRGLAGQHSSTYWEFVRLLEEMGGARPPLLMIENVAGFLSSHHGRDLQIALKALNNLGYAVDLLMIDAVRFVPQSRLRLFIIAQAGDDVEEKSVAEKGTPVFFEQDARPEPAARYIFTHPQIHWRLHDVPRLPPPQRNLESVIEEIPPNDPMWWSAKRRDYLISQMTESHYRRLEAMRTGAKWSYGTVFRRVRKRKTVAELRTDGVAGCLRTPRGGSARQILVKAGFGKVFVRLLTPRECARLMGADDFRIRVPMNQALFGFGDAVCVPVIAWIARHCLSPLAAKCVDSAQTPSESSVKTEVS